MVAESLAAFAALAGLVAIIAAKLTRAVGEPARSYLLFAAALGGALAVVELMAAFEGGPAFALFASVVQLLVAALVPPALLLATVTQYARPLPVILASATLVTACGAGLAAAATGSVVLGPVPLAASAIVIGVLAGRIWRLRVSAIKLALGAIALAAAAAAYMSGGQDGRTGFLLFYAVGQLAVTLAIVSGSDLAVQRGLKQRTRAAISVSRKS